MPLDPNHVHAEVPHDKTVHLASQGWRYTCKDTPRGGRVSYLAHPWAAGGPELVETDTADKGCRYTGQATDAACEGCENQHQPPA